MGKTKLFQVQVTLSSRHEKEDRMKDGVNDVGGELFTKRNIKIGWNIWKTSWKMI